MVVRHEVLLRVRREGDGNRECVFHGQLPVTPLSAKHVAEIEVLGLLAAVVHEPSNVS